MARCAWSLKDGTQTLDLGYDYDASGNILLRSEWGATAAFRDDVPTYDRLDRIVAYGRGLAAREGESIGILPGRQSFAQQWNLDAAGNWLEFDQDNNGDGRFELQQVRTHNPAGEKGKGTQLFLK